MLGGPDGWMMMWDGTMPMNTVAGGVVRECTYILAEECGSMRVGTITRKKRSKKQQGRRNNTDEYHQKRKTRRTRDNTTHKQEGSSGSLTI